MIFVPICFDRRALLQYVFQSQPMQAFAASEGLNSSLVQAIHVDPTAGSPSWFLMLLQETLKLAVSNFMLFKLFRREVDDADDCLGLWLRVVRRGVRVIDARLSAYIGRAPDATPRDSGKICARPKVCPLEV